MPRVYRTLPKLSPQDIQNFWSNVDKTPGYGPNRDCWIWIGLRAQRGGYGVFKFKGDDYRASRIAFFLHTGESLNGWFVCHSCDFPPCCNPNHLFKGTSFDNNADMVSKGRQTCGDRHYLRLNPERARRGGPKPIAKLTKEQVQTIRREFAIGVTRKELAINHGVSYGAIKDIIRKVSWKHL